ncbi:MAG: c-type cytochrome [Luteolibacter sp.]
MKLRFPVILSACICVFISASCQKGGQDAGAPSTPEKEEHPEPWDWIPDDPALLAGREIYMAECSLCHNEGEEASPALTRKDEWEERIQKGEPTLISHAINGFNGEDGEMPARGGTPSLTDIEVTNAVLYMIATPK